ncbi:MAG: type II toxin-antitoxin system VapC family toxin [Myxococcota bacterium]
MDALDTNVLVRYLVDDDVQQGAQAAALIQASDRRRRKLYVSDVVMAELAWVLEEAYGFTRMEIAGAARAVLSSRVFSFRDKARLARAVSDFESGGADLSDYLIRREAESAGAGRLFTFDRKLSREPGCAVPR